VIALAMVLARRGGWAADEPPARVVRYDDDVLTVRLGDVPISEVLADLAMQSGAEVRGQVREPRNVTAAFDSVPLPQALARLLGDQNFALVYGSGGHLKAVRLLGSDAVSVQASTPSAAQRAPFPGALPALIDAHPPVPVTGAVADAVQSESASLRQLLELTLNHPDATVRTEALRTGLAAVEADRDLYVAVIDELDHTDSTFLASLLRASAGERADELAAHVLQEAHAAKIRLMATSVQQRLRRGS
jgi:hypothetical protein